MSYELYKIADNFIDKYSPITQTPTGGFNFDTLNTAALTGAAGGLIGLTSSLRKKPEESRRAHRRRLIRNAVTGLGIGAGAGALAAYGVNTVNPEGGFDYTINENGEKVYTPPQNLTDGPIVRTVGAGAGALGAGKLYSKLNPPKPTSLAHFLQRDAQKLDVAGQRARVAAALESARAQGKAGVDLLAHGNMSSTINPKLVNTPAARFQLIREAGLNPNKYRAFTGAKWANPLKFRRNLALGAAAVGGGALGATTPEFSELGRRAWNWATTPSEPN